jgi:hypothetical protein
MPPASPEPPDSERKKEACPICGKPATEKTRPFCSPRCRDVDLHRWFSGSYVVPGKENAGEDEE